MELLIDKVNSDRKEILKNLMTLHLHDLSEFIDKFEFEQWSFRIRCT